MEFTITEAFALAFGSMGMGLVLLIRGGNWTIDAAVYVAHRFGVSPMLIGFTIVAFGTSFSEMVVSVLANIQGSPGIAIGNVLGSNIANILFVIGVTAFFATLMTSSRAIIKDLTMMLVCTGVLAFLLMHGEIGRLAGLAMIAALIFYIFLQYKMVKSGEMPVESMGEHNFSSQKKAYLYLFLGLLAIGLGAEFLVRGAKVSASVIGVPEAVIALSIIAFGTSLPELSTSIIAARKGQTEMVLGNIIGSNVFNILLILGVTALVKPIAQGSFAPQLTEFDIWLVLLVSVIFSLLLIFFNKIIRPVGVVFICAYVVYNIYIYSIYIGH